jgi:hypothetical protein
MEIIRKISIGPDYLKAMTYTVGYKVKLPSGEFTVHEIKRDENLEIPVFITDKDSQCFKWKTFTYDVPVSIEYDLDF